MKRNYLFIILTILIFSSQGVSGTDFKPVFSSTMNGNCFMVGNTNTELDLAAGTEINESNEGGDIRNIINTPISLDISGSSQTLTLDNCNFAKFCIPNPNQECDTTDIEYARLSWGGRMVDGSIDHRNTVYLQITDDAGNGDGFHEVTAEVGPIIPILKKSSEAGFYSCHADVTELINSILKKGSVNFNNSLKRIYIANVQSELKKSSFLIEGLFSGWSLTIVYKHPTLAKKNIMIYDCDVLGEANENNNKPDPILANFNFGSEKDNILNDTITFGYAAFGGFREQAADRILTNRDSEEELFTKYS
ncbi:MAG TPA: hypothetical protein PLB70_11200 [Paludibacteraceae bacterium]|nr:hypothetical protein [Paludibacteraceae bacterium]